MFDDLQEEINRIMHAQNNLSVEDFEGYSPEEMRHIIYDAFGDNSPIQWKTMTESAYPKIPLFNSIKYLAEKIEAEGEVKLTKTGNLPTRLVKGLYDQGFYKERPIESGIVKLSKEDDSLFVHLTRILLEISGILKKRINKLSITKKGQSIISDNHTLLMTLLKEFCTHFNWAYFDGYEADQVGKMGFGFSLILVKKYGQEQRSDVFYAKKYLKAYPHLLSIVTPSFGTVETYASRCYSTRTFDRFMDLFGLINLEKPKKWDGTFLITKTSLMDKLIDCIHPTG